MVDTTYVGRLTLAMGLPDGVAPEPQALHDLAGAVGITYTAVAKYWTDKSGAMKSKHNVAAARHLQVDPDWLATGKGPMRSERVWPFGTAVTPEQWFALPNDKRRLVIDMIAGQVPPPAPPEAKPPGLSTSEVFTNLHGVVPQQETRERVVTRKPAVTKATTTSPPAQPAPSQRRARS